jgi:addiction module HigA family antidote
MALRQHNPPHPGRVLKHYLDVENHSISGIAGHLRVSRVALSRVLNGRAGISAGMALRLSRALETSPEMWMAMQAKYDLWQAEKSLGKLAVRPLRRRVQHAAAA